jgi:FAD/FMN-containing dehydrogenase
MCPSDPTADIQRLIEGFGGSVLTCTSAGYVEALIVYNAMFERRPAVIAQCSGVEDVVRALRWGRDMGLEIAIRGGGHSVAGYSMCDEGLVIDLRKMCSVRVDPVARTATASGGTLWGEFDAATYAHGLATTGGRVTHTGVAGLTLGSGSGWLERKHGLTCDNLVGATLVTVDGEVVRATSMENADLLWGLRGGGGNFGIVTDFTCQLHPLGEVTFGMILHPLERAVDFHRHYFEYMAEAPDEVAVSVAIVTPDGSLVPERIRGQKALASFFVYLGGEERAKSVLAPLFEFGQPEAVMLKAGSYLELQQMLDPENLMGRRNYWKAANAVTPGDSALAQWVELAGEAPSRLSQALIHPAGGALARRTPDDGPLDTSAPWSLLVVATWVDPSEDAENIAWARDLYDVMAPHMTAGASLNFNTEEFDPAEVGTFGEAYRRLRELKDAWDPENVFRLNQNIVPSSQRGGMRAVSAES